MVASIQPFEWLIENAGSIATILSIITPIVGFQWWFYSLIHKDIERIESTANKAHDRIDAMGTRFDAMGSRMDHMYTLMMVHLTGKEPPEYPVFKKEEK